MSATPSYAFEQSNVVSLTDDQIKKVSAWLARSFTDRVEARQRDIAAQHPDKFVYVMPRPAWIGFNEAIKDRGAEVVQLLDGGFMFSTAQPLPYKALDDFECLPIGEASTRALMSTLAEGRNLMGLTDATSDRYVIAWEARPGKYMRSEFDFDPADDAEASLRLVSTETFNSLPDVLHSAFSRLPGARVVGASSPLRVVPIDFEAQRIFCEANSIRSGSYKPAWVQGDTPEAALSFYFNTLRERRGEELVQRYIDVWQNGATARRLLLLADVSESRLSALTSGLKSSLSKAPPVLAPAPSAAVNWVDLSSIDCYIGEQKLAGGGARMVLLDMQNQCNSEALASVGFIEMPGAAQAMSGIYCKQGADQTLRVKQLAKALGMSSIPIISTTAEAIAAQFKQKANERYQTNMSALIKVALPIGTNFSGYPVFASPAGRFVRNDKGVVSMEDTAAGRRLGVAAFMRATDAESLRLVADGVVMMIRQGQRIRPADLKTLATHAFDHQLERRLPDGEVPQASDAQVHALQEALEASAYRNFLANANGPTRESFDDAKGLYYALPTAQLRTAASLNLQQYSTPLPMGVISQRLLLGNDDVVNKTLLEPTAGNGGLTTVMPDSVSVYAAELDANRVEALRNVRGIRGVVQADAVDLNFQQAFGVDAFDYMITNPPFGAMDESREFGPIPQVRKLDHYIPLRALAARRDVGRSVIILGADSPRSDGTLSTSSKQFLNYLSDHYEVEGSVEVDGRLYARQGSSFNVRIIVVGDRRAVPLEAADVPDKLPIISDYDALWQWSSDLITHYGHHKLASPPVAIEAVVEPQPAAELDEDMPFGLMDDVILPAEFANAGLASITVVGTAEDFEAAKVETASVVASTDVESIVIRAIKDAVQAQAPDAVSAEQMTQTLLAPQVDTQLTPAEAAAVLDATLLPSRQTDAPSVPDVVAIGLQSAALSDDVMDRLQPWQMTQMAWTAAWTEVSSQPTSPASMARGVFLNFGVTDWASERLGLHESKEIALSADELAQLHERLNAPVTHRDVIDKALGAGLAVPSNVLAPYPEFSTEKTRKQNDFQVPYQSASKVGVSDAMIPINMSASIYAALNDLEATYGPIDDYVASRLQYPLEELGQIFSAEQVDALGLGIRACEEGRGMINADQTGMGKGRWVAGMLRYAKLSGKLPVFVTIKPELFTDIFRDIGDIRSEDAFKKVFIFNDAVNVRRFGSDSKVLFAATRPEARKKALEAGAVPDDTDMVLLTYSQLARSFEVNPKARLLTQLASQNAMILMDEAHVASGESNIGSTMSMAVTAANSVMYSSATPLKSVKSFGIYSKIFPRSVDIKNLADTLEAGGDALSEAISANMARDGVLIRREHDLSQLTFKTIFPPSERAARNVDMANKLAVILARMSYLSGDVSEQVVALNDGFAEDFERVSESDREGGRMQASSMNFGSRLYSINRQFLMGIKIDDAIESALLALSEGRKPAIAVENTGESLTNLVILKRLGLIELSEELDALDSLRELTPEQALRMDEINLHIQGATANMTLDKPPQFRELLSLMMDRACRIKVQGRYGEVTYREPDSKEFALFEEETRALIDAFPDLSLTPLDEIKNAFAAQGLSCGEVSGRGLSLVANSATGLLDVKRHPKSDTVSEVAKYQNGTHDCIIITRAGSTGISLHATNRFADSDYRQREFIVLQPASNIADFLQWAGRVNRKDQVVFPILASIESGLPCEYRLSMMLNAKLRQLSANTSSNRDDANLTDSGDLLNIVGDAVAEQWLLENPDVAKVLDIKMLSEEESLQRDCYYINKVMGRIMMAGTVDRQERIFQTLDALYKERIQDLTDRGLNPFIVDVHEWSAKVVNEEALDNASMLSSSSSFDSEVKIATLNYEETVEPMTARQVNDRIISALGSYQCLSFIDSRGQATGWRDQLFALRDRFVKNALPLKLRENVNVEVLLNNSKDGEHTGAKNARDKADWLIKNITSARPGTVVMYNDIVAGDLMGVITKIGFPDEGSEFMLSQYPIEVCFPTEERPRHMTLSALKAQDVQLSSDLYNRWDMSAKYGNASLLRQAFDDAPTGSLVRSRHVLLGNTYRATELGATMGIGYPILYTNEDGHRQRGVLLKAGVTPAMVKAIPVPLAARDVCEYVVRHVEKYGRPQSWGELQMIIMDRPKLSTDSNEVEGITLRQNSYGFTITLPGLKSKSGKLLSDGSIMDNGKAVEGSLNLSVSGNRTALVGKFDDDQLKPLLERLQANDHVASFYIPNVDKEILNDIRAMYQDEQVKETRRLARKARRAAIREGAAEAEAESLEA